MYLQSEHSFTIRPDKNYILFGFIMSIIFLCSGLIGQIISQNIILILSFIPMAVVWFLILRQEIARRPIHAHICDDIRLSFRTRTPSSIPFDDIEWVDASPGDPTTLAGRINRGGKMKVQGMKHPIPLGYEAAEAVRRSYKERNGMYPPPHPRLAAEITQPHTRE